MPVRLVFQPFRLTFFGILITISFAAVLSAVSIQPNAVVEGTSVTLNIEGAGFVDGLTTLRTSSNLSVTSIQVISPTLLQATVVAGVSGLASVQVATGPDVSPPMQLAISPSTLDTTPSFTPTFLAGRVVHPGTPDGIGASAYLDQPGWLAVCRGQVYFTDNVGLRALDPASRRVTTLIAGFNHFVPLWCGGKFLYTSSTADGGKLTIGQTDLDTLQQSSFSYAVTGSYTIGTTENLWGAGSALYTTDSAAGVIWKIDLNMHERDVVIDFGGPVLTMCCPYDHPSLNHLVASPVGPLWTDGSTIYLLRSQPPSLIAPGIKADLTSIDISTGQRALLATGAFTGISGNGSVLYLRGPGSLQRFDLVSGQLTPFVSIDNSGGFWVDNSTIYLTVSFPDGAIGTIDPVAATMTVLAGALDRDLDGSGSAADFGIYLLPGAMKIWGDSNSLYILEYRSLRRYDRATQVVSTLTTDVTYGAGLWSDGLYAYFGDRASVRRIDLKTKRTTTIVTDTPFDEVEEIWGDGTNLYINDHYSAIRKLELASGMVTTLLQRDGIYRGLWGMGRSLYFCDTRMIRRLNLDTLLTETIAGGDPEGSQDGVGTDARFSRADGVWGDGVSVFITDAMRTIRRLELATNRVTTVYSSAEPLSTGIFGDGSYLYLMEGYSFRRYDPESSTLTFAAPGQGLSITDLASARSLSAVPIHSQIDFSGGSAPAAGIAIWGYRNSNGVLVSEAAVPAQSTIRSGRIYADVEGPVNTGIAISNPADNETQINFYFTGGDGTDFGSGSITLKPHQEMSRFLNEPPFSGGSSINGTFTFSASAPVAAVAIRGLTNERSEFLMTTLPVVDLDAAVSRDSQTIAHFATGGGWTTQILLVNPTDQVLTGTLQFIDDSGQAGSPLGYSIPSRSSQNIRGDSASMVVRKGSVAVTPAASAPAPVPLVVFSYAPAGVTVTETGVPAVGGTNFLSYVESTGASVDQTISGIAIANPGDQPVRVFLELANSLGQSVAQSATIDLGPRMQIAKFMAELFPSLQSPFIGVVRISSSSNISVAGLRGRYNSRQEFIVATVTPVPEPLPPLANPPSVSPLYFPHLITGGGYSTRLFFINATGTWSTGTMQFLNTDGTPANF